jgi:subtilisin family serine protease
MQLAQTTGSIGSCIRRAGRRGGPLVGAVLLIATLAAAADAGASQQDDLTRVAVGYAPGAAQSTHSLEQALGARLLDSLDSIGADIVGVAPQRSAAVIATLRSAPGVRYAQVDGRAYAAGTPNDEYWPQQWSQAKTHAPQAWDLTTGSSSVVVAVVDTGVDAGQPDLVGRVLPGYDFVNGDTDPSDDEGHGTAVAGVVAAAGDNRIGVAGYCWSCRVLPVKVLGADGSGFNSRVAAGILWAVDHGAKVVNASLGSLSDDLTLGAAAQYAAQHGVLVVAAAGNDGVAQLRYPAALPGVLSVGATDPTDTPYSFSNSGAAVAAPGENVTTATQGGYVVFLGTSSAAPVVSGIAGLALSAAPGATAGEVAQALEATANPSPGSVYGRVDAYATVHSIAPSLAPTPVSAQPPAQSPTPGSLPARSAASQHRELRGRLTTRRPQQGYVLRTGIGVLNAALSPSGPTSVRLEIRLLAPGGSIVVVCQGNRARRCTTAVDPARYRLVVRRVGRGAPISYSLALAFPAP